MVRVLDVDASVEGAPSWFELMTSGPVRARSFNEALFGCVGEQMPGQAMPYTTFKLGERFVALMMALTPAMQDVPPHWATYFTVMQYAR